MTRRPVLPGAAELFRRTDTVAAEPAAQVTELPSLAAAASSSSLRGKRAGSAAGPAEDAQGMPLSLVPPAPPVEDELADQRAREVAPAPRVAAPVEPPRRGRPSVERPKHEEKITVYCSAEELMALEQARLTLRGQHGVVADRGRIVRTAIEVLLADLAARGDESVLVRRLQKP
ncbi:hypothetical protein GB931_17805 [Modestobacter sp. I12A-02628]|uniref:Cobyrinic acid a,c-diamide synthase n=1 Tax=Goekera deserti TaxID=2497753 RepID=A0A7K3WFW7_9ACTN|nr:hypothetical protein [Goekera deserti]MPQ99740.1 hypothetical protein [Goekera deserti]NDI46249.1 hypothetical protein [Goekera deserti]NEL54819.1 hypothetical protein [Goekera deserti]